MKGELFLDFSKINKKKLTLDYFWTLKFIIYGLILELTFMGLQINYYT